MDRELIIKLSTEVERLRGQLREAEALVERRKGQLESAIAQLDAVLVSAAPAPQLPDFAAVRDQAKIWLAAETVRQQLKETENFKILLGASQLQTGIEWYRGNPQGAAKVAFVSEGTVAARIRHTFQTNPDVSFKAADLMSLLHLEPKQENLVRQTLRRLYEGGMLLKEAAGTYRYIPIGTVVTAVSEHEK